MLCMQKKCLKKKLKNYLEEKNYIEEKMLCMAIKGAQNYQPLD